MIVPKSCFVVGPIGSDDSPERIHADWLLEMIIHPALESIGEFTTLRADGITTPGQIDAQVIRHLLEDDLVIADLSFLNPNAFYEIGIRHMVQKPIIHMQLAEERIPFDVSIYRSIKFSRQRPSDIRQAKTRLQDQVSAIFSQGYEVENPITLARGRVQFEARASSDEKVLISQIAALSNRMESLERRAFDFRANNFDRFTSLSNLLSPSTNDVKYKITLDRNKISEKDLNLFVARMSSIGSFKREGISIDGKIIFVFSPTESLPAEQVINVMERLPSGALLEVVPS